YRDWIVGVPSAALTPEHGHVQLTGSDQYGPPRPRAATELADPGQSAVAMAVRSELAAVGGVSLLTAGVAGSPDLYRADDPIGFVDLLLADPRVEYAQRNYYLDSQYVPNDPDFTK